MIEETVLIRDATVADLPAIVAMLADDALGRQREDPSTTLNPKYLDAFKAIEIDVNQVLAVAECDGQVTGCLQLTLIPGLSRLGMWRGQIESVRVAADRRGEGIGRRMFEWALEECRMRDAAWCS